jgi:hypothetical protein
MRRVIEREHPTFSVFGGVIEVWVNIGLKGHEGTEPTRFVPQLPIQWTDSNVWATAGVISSEALKCDHNSNGNPWAGRIAIPYKNLADTDARTIHSWLADLHGRMRGTATPCTAGRDNYGIRSITVLVQDKTVKNSECTSTGIFFAREWGDDKVQAESGHYLALVPRSVSGIEQSVVASVNSMLRRIEKNILGTNEMEGLDDSYENFINEVFYPSATCDKSAEEQYIMWWKSNAFSSDSDPPPCRAFSTIAIGCDGLSHDDPDTLMVFSSVAIPPRALQASSEHLVSLCNRLSKLESEVLIENQATARAQLAERDQQHRAMVSSFGHDGKRPAATIEMLLENPSEFAPKLAMLLSRSLVLRLESFSALLGTPASRDQAHQQLQQEWTDAEDSTTLRQIYEEQAFSVLLQILIGESNWKVIRNAIFGENRSLDDFREQLSPILRFLAEVMEAKQRGLSLGQDGQNAQKRHDAIQATLNCFKRNSDWSGFNLGYEGPDLKLPYYIPGKDGAKTVPLAATAFSFLISEILTNSAKHQWRKLSRQLSDDGLSVMMSVAKSQGQYDISVLSRPVLPAGSESVIAGSVTGLTSMSMVGERLGITISSRQIQVGHAQAKRWLPYPVNEPLEVSDDKSPWSTVQLRGFPERADQ